MPGQTASTCGLFLPSDVLSGAVNPYYRKIHTQGIVVLLGLAGPAALWEVKYVIGKASFCELV